MSLPRPPATLLRTPLMNQAKKHMAFAMVLGVATGIAYKVFVTDPRKRAYTKFHQTWDRERHYKRMVEAGVFQYVRPETAQPEWISQYEKEVDLALAAQK